MDGPLQYKHLTFKNAFEDAQGQDSPFWRLIQKHILKNQIQNNQYKHGSPVALRGCRGDV